MRRGVPVPLTGSDSTSDVFCTLSAGSGSCTWNPLTPVSDTVPSVPSSATTRAVQAPVAAPAGSV